MNVSLALDDEGKPHMCYVREGALVHAFKNAESWTTEVVETAAGTPDASGPSATTTWVSFIPSSSIAAGSGRIHIAYLISPPYLMHAVKSDEGWSIESVDDRASSYTRRLSLALDAKGNPHISYCGYPNCRSCPCSLKYAVKLQRRWQVGFVDSTTTGSPTIAGLNSSLSLDGDIPHIVTNVDEIWRHRLLYSIFETRWAIETITDQGKEDMSLALDSEGGPHIAWITEDSVDYGRRDEAGAWQVEEFFESVDPGDAVSIGLDGKDNVHIIYATEDGLKYLKRAVGGNWKADLVDAEAIGFVPFRGISLALDDQGRPHIAYVGTNEFLPGRITIKYAFRL